MNETVLQARQVTPRRGLDWLVEGFALFRRNPLIWIVLVSAYLLIGMVISMIPVLGPIVLNLLAPVFVAGFMIGCRALDQGEELEIGHLFAGFRHNAAQLVTIGGIYLAGIIIIVGIMFAGTDHAALEAVVSGKRMSPEETQAVLGDSFFMSSLLGLLLLVPLIMIPTMIASLYVSYKDVFAQSLATQEAMTEEE